MNRYIVVLDSDDKKTAWLIIDLVSNQVIGRFPMGDSATAQEQANSMQSPVELNG